MGRLRWAGLCAALLVVGCTAPDDGTIVAAPASASSSTTTSAVPVEHAVATSVVTTTTTVATTTTLPPRGRLVIHGTGDVNLDPSYIRAFRSRGYGWAWSGLDGLFLGDDLTVINLECAVSELGQPVEKEFNFRCDLAALPAMREAGVEVTNLANNHSGDFGPEAMVDSRTNVENAGLFPVGVGKDADAAHQPLLYDRNGWRIAVVGFGGVVPDNSWIATSTRPGMADGDDIPSMVAAVEAAEAVADLVVVTLHWGVELDTQPQPDDVERAEAMVAAGADIIFGHHSHRLNPLGWVEGKPVAWGLGNFVWPRLSAEGADTAVAEVVVEPDGRMGACLIPVTIVSDGHPALDAPYAGPCAP